MPGMDPAVAAERLEHSDGGVQRVQAKRLETLMRRELDEEGTANGEAPAEGHNLAVSEDGRYSARTSDPSLSILAIARDFSNAGTPRSGPRSDSVTGRGRTTLHTRPHDPA